MARKRYKPEEIRMLRQAEVLHRLGMSMADATRQLGISDVGTVSADGRVLRRHRVDCLPGCARLDERSAFGLGDATAVS